MVSEEAANRALRLLLDSLGKVLPNMACFWIREYQKRLGIHFHVIFLFFGEETSEPLEMRARLAREVFVRWNKIHNGALCRAANRMTVQRKDFGCISYLLKGICPVNERLRREPHWNGLHNRRLIKAHSSPVSPKEVHTMYAQLFDYRALYLALPRDQKNVDDEDTL